MKGTLHASFHTVQLFSSNGSDIFMMLVPSLAGTHCMPLASFPISEGFANGAMDACVATAVVCVGGGFWFWSAIVIGASCYDLSFALLHADTSDCFLSSLPHPLTRLLYFYDLILLTRSHLVASCLYDMYLMVRYNLLCTIHIYEPLIRLLVVLGEFRFPST